MSMMKYLFFLVVYLPLLNVEVANAFSCPNNTTLTEAQIQQLQQMQTGCAHQNNFGDPNGYNNCQQSIVDLLATFCRDNKTVLTDDQQAEIDKKRQECIAAYPSGSEQLIQCLRGVELYQMQLRAQGAGASDENRFDDYINKYTAPTLTAKTYSNIRECEFHSFNDIWKNASNMERNAELFTRSFEYVFVGAGTQDYWQDGENGNVFSRANKVARELRRNRKRLIEATNEVDRKSECYCIGVFGPQLFPQQKRDKFFGSTCSDIRSAMGGLLATGEQTNSNVGSAALNSTNQTSFDQANIETIDKGALGISYEMALIEYTRLRSNLALERFTNNNDDSTLNIEKELHEMSEFLIGTDFEEVWKPKIQGSGTSAFMLQDQKDSTESIVWDSNVNLANSPNNSVRIYKWGFRYWNTFLSIVFTVLSGGLALIGGSLFNSGDSATTQAFNMHGVKAAYGPDGKYWPEVYDLQKKDNAQFNGGWGLKYDGFERYYIGPEFNNKSTVADTHCHVMARASACLKVAYKFSPGSLKYLEGFPDTGHFIIDPKLPPLVSGVTIETQFMPGKSKPWTKIVNDTVHSGVKFLATRTNPDAWGEKRVKSKSGFRVTRSASKYRKHNMMEHAFSKGEFKPFKRNYSPTVFDSNFKNAIINGATRYAMCKELKNNAECPVPDAQEGDLGFGYLFENQQEAIAWAEYTYELHYIYSSVSKDAYMGYPLLGQNYYFEAMSSKIKLLDNIYKQRSEDLNNLMQLYASDLEKRIKDYKSLGELYNGTHSKNIKYNKKFFEAMAQLNFSGTSNIEAFNQIVQQGQNSGAFNDAELKTLGALKDSAIRTNSAIKKGEDFNKEVSNLKGSMDLDKLSTVNQKLLNPIGAITAANKGSFGNNGFLGSKLDAISKQLASISKKVDIKKEQPYQNPFSNVSIPSYNSGYSAPVDQPVSTTNSEMSRTEADNLIRQLNNNKELTERLENDTLFTIVSKAYKRNYSRVLFRSLKAEAKKKETVITDQQKAELKELLEDGGK